jgi:protein TonB
MTNSSNYAYATLDDIVFEGRNREYGAYLLRKLYVTNLWRGMAIAISLFLLFLSIPLISTKFFPAPIDPIIEQPDETTVTLQGGIVEPKPETPQPLVQPKQDITPPAAAPTRQFVAPVITANPNEINTMPEGPLPAGVQPGTTNSAGTGGTTTVVTPGTGTAPTVVPPSDEILNIAEVNPSFPGGQEALMKYLGNHMTYPELAKRNALEGMVVVQFVVNEEGAISDIVVLKKLGGGTDEEAMRVIKNMPRWSPGKQNGRNVKVRFTLPIRFTLGR